MSRRVIFIYIFICIFIFISSLNMTAQRIQSNIKNYDKSINKIGKLFVVDSLSEKLEIDSTIYKFIDLVVKDAIISPSLEIMVTGHWDNSKKLTENAKISQDYTKLVSEYMKKQGIEDGRIIECFCGSLKPVAPNDLEINKSKNRRIEILLIRR